MKQPVEGQIIVEPMESGPEVAAAIAAVAGRNQPAILDTSLPNRFSRFSVFACDPVQVVEVNDFAVSPIRALVDRLTRPPAIAMGPNDLPFTGGWIGFVTYEAGLDAAAGGLIPQRRNFDLPLARFALYDSAAVLDHTTGNWCLAAIDWPRKYVPNRPAVADRLRALRAWLESAKDEKGLERRSGRAKAGELRPDSSRDSYIQRVQRIQEYIAAGDVYQVNLAARFLARSVLTPGELFLRLREASPAPFSAFLSWQDRAVLSSSPELFLTLRDGQVITRPIKGTRPRANDAARDQVQRASLAGSEKDRAELNMIIDLMRNDLGRVCRFGSINVADEGELEVHPTVHHRVATVEGRLRGDCTWADLLEAAFPGGSVTGAPKTRAMQIISELEPFPRGVYCGSIGWIGLDGSLSLNLAIRTMFQSGRRVELFAGSGIVADSVPEQEYDEVLAKLSGMQRALGGRMREDRSSEIGAA